MAKKGQRATWENDHFKSAKKPMAARVPEVNNVGKNKSNSYENNSGKQEDSQNTENTKNSTNN